ncbi:MAG TPA: DUF1800 domain-containing protein, partial [Pseudolabrys sp.]|nr:DUF1800 domain-containing protein [Pseudolabrys sp.]
MAIDFGASEPKAQAAFVLHRFGFGPRPGDIERIASDPRGALLAELKPAAGLLKDPDLPSGGAAFREAFEFRQERKAEREARRMQPGMTPDIAAKPRQGGMIPLPQQIYLTEAKARYDAALSADVGLVERLVWFWSNHFCVSADKGPTRPLCGAYEREAIRPHVLGKFSDMLLAVETHPAMLLYLDNARSIGPNSFAGLRRGKGLNENLAREIMELHTLGVRTGYTQADVTSFAKVITGWSIRPPKQDAVHGGEFWFNERLHEPGPQTIIGKTYAEDCFGQGRAVLETLAHHPATAKHIATKLATHFVADAPPPALVERLAKRLRDTGGDLLQVTKTLVTAPEAWQSRDKLKKPGEWAMAAMRVS